MIVVGIVLAVCCVGGIVVGGLVFTSIRNAAKPAQASVDTFVTHLEAGETDAAYDSLCSRARDQFTREQFAQIVNDQSKPTQHTMLGANVSNVNGRASASVTAELHYSDGRTDRHLFLLEQEAGVWRVCGQPY